MEHLKTFVKQHFAYLLPVWRRLNAFNLQKRLPEDIFSEIYRKNKWGDTCSRSGTGSNLIQTAAIREALPMLINELGCKTLLDIPCGDYFWMSNLGLDIDYIGADIVKDMILKNQANYGSEGRRFAHINLLEDVLPKADIILCRDCIVHFSFQHAFRAFRNIKESGCDYLLTTTFTEKGSNEDIPTGSWRAINLLKPPFNFPAPLSLIDEKFSQGNYSDKALGLWRLSDIPDFESPSSPS